MTTTYEPVPGRLAEVIAYLMVRRFNRLSGAAGNYEQGQAPYSEYRTDATNSPEMTEVRTRTEAEM